MSEQTQTNAARENAISLKIKTLNDQMYNISLQRDASIPQLKEIIASATGVVIDRQRLIYRGRVLKNDKNISTYSLEDGHTLHLVVRPENSPSSNANEEPSASSVPNSEMNPLMQGRVLMGATITVPEGADIDMQFVNSMISNIIRGIQGGQSTNLAPNVRNRDNRSSRRVDGGRQGQQDASRRRVSASRRSSGSRISAAAAGSSGNARIASLLERVRGLLEANESSVQSEETSSEFTSALMALQCHVRDFLLLLTRAQGQLQNLPNEIGQAFHTESLSSIPSSVRILQTLGELCSSLAQQALRISRPRDGRTRLSVTSFSLGPEGTAGALEAPSPHVQALFEVMAGGPLFRDEMVDTNGNTSLSLDARTSSPSNVSAVPVLQTESSTATSNRRSNKRNRQSVVDLPGLWKEVVSSVSVADAMRLYSGDGEALQSIMITIAHILMSGKYAPSLETASIGSWSSTFITAVEDYLKSQSLTRRPSYAHGSEPPFEILKVARRSLPTIIDWLLRAVISTGESTRFSANATDVFSSMISEIVCSLHGSAGQGYDVDSVLIAVLVDYGIDDRLASCIATRVLSSKKITTLLETLSRSDTSSQAKANGSSSSTSGPSSSGKRRRRS